MCIRLPLFVWSHGVVASHPLSMRAALGLITSVPIFNDVTALVACSVRSRLALLMSAHRQRDQTQFRVCGHPRFNRACVFSTCAWCPTHSLVNVVFVVKQWPVGCGVAMLIVGGVRGPRVNASKHVSNVAHQAPCAPPVHTAHAPATAVVDPECILAAHRLTPVACCGSSSCVAHTFRVPCCFMLLSLSLYASLFLSFLYVFCHSLCFSRFL